MALVSGPEWAKRVSVVLAVVSAESEWAVELEWVAMGSGSGATSVVV